MSALAKSCSIVETFQTLRWHGSASIVGHVDRPLAVVFLVFLSFFLFLNFPFFEPPDAWGLWAGP